MSCAVTQRLLATGMHPTIARAMSRQVRTLYSASSTLCGQHFARPGTPALPLHHVACSGRIFPTSPLSAVQTHCYSSSAPKKSSTERIKVILKEYGVVAVVFHTVMSLGSLGTCYLIVSRSVRQSHSHAPITACLILPYSGVDVGKVLEYFNVQSSATSKGASTFAVAYVFHKMLLPLRAGITVAAVPLIVRWLRTRGWVKGVVKQVQSK